MNDLERLLVKIVEYNDLPKFQVERALSPFFCLYIEKIISIIYNNEEIKLIAAEFPLKKDNNQSTNVDYLLINENSKKLLLVELKTNNRAALSNVFNHQKKYENIIEEIRKNNSKFLHDDVCEISRKSSHIEKYDFLKQNIDRLNAKYCDGEIIYIVPETTKNKFKESNIKLRDTAVYSFKELPSKIDGFTDYELFHRYINKLN